MSIAVGIVLFNPDIKRLEENINAIIDQCTHIFLVDNFSQNINDIIILLSKYNNSLVTLIQNNKNEGIAKALNQLSEVSINSGYEWLLTLDQDSVCPSNIIYEFSKHLDDQCIGIICPEIDDINHEKRVVPMSGIIELDECITSGSLMKLSTWRDIGGFDEYMFIDDVDFEYCYRIRKEGYKIIQVKSVVLMHEIGKAEKHRFLWRYVYADNHSPFRIYYISRNSIYFSKKHGLSMFKSVKCIAKRVLKILLFEDQKRAKINQMYRGVMDGIKYCIH